MAYSKICTHAGCAISLFRFPLYEPQSPGAALACPCHYSTFDVRRGGLVVFGPAALPLIDRVLFTRDKVPHHLLDRPRDNPRRTAFGVAFLTWIAIALLFGASDRLFLAMSISYTVQLWLFPTAFLLAPALAYAVTKRLCARLRATGEHPLRGVQARVIHQPVREAADDPRSHAESASDSIGDRSG